MTTTDDQSTTSTAPAGAAKPGTRRILSRWLVSFLGFPLGGYLAFLVVGPIDRVSTALIGGLLAGAVLGGAQAWALGTGRLQPLRWVVATSAGMAAGVALGAAVVEYATDLGALLVQGAVTGAGVGLAQAVVLFPRLRTKALLWPVALTALWALGWLVTDTVIGTSVDQQFYIFGASGALVVTALTSVLPLVLNRHADDADHRVASTERSGS